MSFTLHQVTQRASGSDIVRIRHIESAEPVIGRGTDCDIQIADLAVSLRHAVMRQTGRGRVEVKSLGQLAFEADGAFTKNAQLSLADRPKLVFGSHELRLAPGDKADEIVVTLSRTESVAGEPDVQDEKSVFALAASMFSRRTAAWTFGAMLLALCLALPIAAFVLYRGTPVAASPKPAVPRADVQWEGGALSSGHRFLEGNCQACHRKAFVSVRDEACVACHKKLATEISPRLVADLRAAGSPDAPEPARDHAPSDRRAKARPMRDDVGQNIHAAVERTFNHPEGRCASCHTEHVGAEIAAKGSVPPAVTANEVVENDCADCHADLKRHLPDTALLDVADWRHHPDFRPLVTVSPTGPRIALADRPVEKDDMIFPHYLHLWKKGGVARMAQRLRKGAALNCESCHRLNTSGNYEPIKMKDECSSCHSLDLGNGGGKLPHGDVIGTIAKLKRFYGSGGGASSGTDDLFLGRPGSDFLPPEPRSDRIARGVRAAFSPDAPGSFLRGGVCYGCHTIKQPPAGSLAFDIVKPRIIDRYMPRGGFDHGVPAHRMDANGRPICITCHQAYGAGRANHLEQMLPPISRCAACHGQSKRVTPQAASDTCSECHGYHDPGMPAVGVAATWEPLKGR